MMAGARPALVLELPVLPLQVLRAARHSAAAAQGATAAALLPTRLSPCHRAAACRSADLAAPRLANLVGWAGLSRLPGSTAHSGRAAGPLTQRPMGDCGAGSDGPGYVAEPAAFHTQVLLMAWFWLEYAQSLQFIGLLFNTSVHVVMYYYYFRRVLGWPVWWKRYVTTFQIVQVRAWHVHVRHGMWMVPAWYAHGICLVCAWCLGRASCIYGAHTRRTRTPCAPVWPKAVCYVITASLLLTSYLLSTPYAPVWHLGLRGHGHAGNAGERRRLRGPAGAHVQLRLQHDAHVPILRRARRRRQA